MDDVPPAPLGDETIAQWDAFSGEYWAERLKRGSTSIEPVIADDPALQPYSIRLTRLERHRLRGLARMANTTPSELARQFIQEGQLRLMQRLSGQADESTEARSIAELKAALRDAMAMVENLERGRG